MYHAHTLTNFVAGFRILDERPVHLRDMHESFEALFQFDEDAEFGSTRS